MSVTSKFSVLALLPPALTEAASAALSMDYSDAPENVVKDLDNLHACVEKSVSTVARMVNSLLVKPSVRAYLSLHDPKPSIPEEPTTSADTPSLDLDSRLARIEIFICQLMQKQLHLTK